MDAGFHVEKVDIQNHTVIFSKPSIQYKVRREGDTILWSGSMVHALRLHLDISQAELADILGVRQQTISEWENNIYQPTRSRSKHLNLVAEKAGFDYLETEKPSREE
jgi:DNA-binding transcriptional regulator YiaG